MAILIQIKLKQLITDKTTAIVPVHVYGNPAEIEKIEEIAGKHNLKVIYDAAHAFGVTKNGKSILTWGLIYFKFSCYQNV